MGMIDPKTLVMGLVAWMKAANVTPTRTRLIKFLYLADLHHARYHEGKTITGWNWYVDKFGPLAKEGLATLDNGVASGWLMSKALPASDDPDGVSYMYIYDIPYKERDAAIQAMPASLSIMRQSIAKFGDDTFTLLSHVYSNTEPMMNAEPGQVLDFSNVRPIVKAKLLPSKPMRKADKDRLLNAMTKIRKSADSRDVHSMISDGPYDDIYRKEMPVESFGGSQQYIDD